MPDEEKLPWEGKQSSGWKVGVDGWTWQSVGEDEWAKSGSCARCRHQVTIVHGSLTVSALESSELSRQEELVGGDPPRGVAAGDGDLLFARCNCGEGHPGRPTELSRGCGACAYIDRPVSA